MLSFFVGVLLLSFTNEKPAMVLDIAIAIKLMPFPSIPTTKDKTAVIAIMIKIVIIKKLEMYFFIKLLLFTCCG